MPDDATLTWGDIETWNSLEFWGGNDTTPVDPSTVTGSVTINPLIQSAKSPRRK